MHSSLNNFTRPSSCFLPRSASECWFLLSEKKSFCCNVCVRGLLSLPSRFVPINLPFTSIAHLSSGFLLNCSSTVFNNWNLICQQFYCLVECMFSFSFSRIYKTYRQTSSLQRIHLSLWGRTLESPTVHKRCFFFWDSSLSGDALLDSSREDVFAALKILHLQFQW